MVTLSYPSSCPPGYSSYSIDLIRDEARHLVESGTLSTQHSIASICRFFPERERPQIEHELELNQYLLRDRLCDLITDPRWDND
ncbi:MAG: DUF4327 family protein [Pseudanabaenaceae cyanobacterium bins.68]|nr:DUF4327 family protein [Pseudanabaenaceae cyanobacterium bins.68]